MAKFVTLQHSNLHAIIVAPSFQRWKGPPIALLILLDDHGFVVCALPGHWGLDS